MTDLPVAVAELLAKDDPARLEQALDRIATDFGASTATLHRAEPAAKLLHLVAQRGLPEPMINLVKQIPFGKGMAGICAERAEAIDICNLARDESGTARPSARLIGVQGAICVPILAPDGAVAGTLGIGKPGEHTYSDAEKETLLAVARVLRSRVSVAAGGTMAESQYLSVIKVWAALVWADGKVTVQEA